MNGRVNGGCNFIWQICETIGKLEKMSHKINFTSFRLPMFYQAITGSTIKKLTPNEFVLTLPMADKPVYSKLENIVMLVGLNFKTFIKSLLVKTFFNNFFYRILSLFWLPGGKFLE